jgi:hypothetical protein
MTPPYIMRVIVYSRVKEEEDEVSLPPWAEVPWLLGLMYLRTVRCIPSEWYFIKMKANHKGSLLRCMDPVMLIWKKL